MRDTFQMCKLDLEKAERNQRSQGQHHRKSKGIAEKHLLLFTDNTKAFDCVDHDKLRTILKEMEIPDHLTCFLRNLYAGQEAIVRTRHGTTDWFKIGKGVQQGCILSPCLFNYMQCTSYEISGWMNHNLESRLLGKISTTSDMQIIPLQWQKVKRN